jgi:hypothetical protein
MADAAWVRGEQILRSVPWLSVGSASAAAAVLLAVAVLARQTGLAPLAALLGLAACGGAAGYVLDDDALSVADATPVSRRHRTTWRLLATSAPAAVAAMGLFALDRVDPATHWLRLVPFAGGTLAMGVSVAAVLVRRGFSTPGDLAGVLTVMSVVAVTAVNPLRSWVSLMPLGDSGSAGRSTLLWIVVVAACAAVVFTCARDPASPRLGRT